MKKAKLAIFDKHHKMERFGIVFIILCVLLTGIILDAIKITKNKSKTILTAQTIYSGESIWSLSHVNINIENIYRNKDNTKCFILFKEDIGGSDESGVTQISDVNKYKVGIQGNSDTKITHNLSGSIYMFGDTGYKGLFISDALGFEPAKATLLLQDNSFVKTSETVANKYANMGDSFKNSNQCTFTVNLAGANAKKVDFLDKDDTTAKDIYSEIIVANKAKELKDTLKNDLIEYNSCLYSINQAKNKLINYGFTNIPAIPGCIASDSVVSDINATTNNPLFFNDMMISSVASDTSDFKILDENKMSDTKKSDDIYLVTNFVYPGGCQYNHQSLKLNSDYLDSFLPSGLSYDAWKANLVSEADMSQDLTQCEPITADNLTLNGSLYEHSSGNSGNNDNGENVIDTTKEAYNRTIDSYISSVNKAMDLKKQYQTIDLVALLDLMNSISTVNSITKISTTSNLITVY